MSDATNGTSFMTKEASDAAFEASVTAEKSQKTAKNTFFNGFDVLGGQKETVLP